LFSLKDTKAFTQNKQNDLNKFFSTLYQNQEFNGNVLIAENGKTVYKRSFGFADINGKILNNDNSEFTLASVSKTLTSTAILQLKEKGKLKLDDPLIKYFPDFPYTEITIRLLLSHTSGLPDYDLYKDQMDKNANKIFSNKDIFTSLNFGKSLFTFVQEKNGSFNTYDSYGEALANIGKKEEAIYMYEKSIALNPKNVSGKRL
jgi:tetratricopeptide (TPR) repeat protein